MAIVVAAQCTCSACHAAPAYDTMDDPVVSSDYVAFCKSCLVRMILEFQLHHTVGAPFDHVRSATLVAPHFLLFYNAPRFWEWLQTEDLVTIGIDD